MNFVLVLVLIAALAALLCQAIMARKVKSKQRALNKLGRSLGVAGEEIKAGMKEADDPTEVLLSKPDYYQDKMIAGLQRAKTDGKITQGLEKARRRGSYKKSIDRAAAHYMEAAPRMKENYGEGYDKRAAVIQRINDELAELPTDTIEQRAEKSKQFQIKMHQAKVAGEFQ